MFRDPKLPIPPPLSLKTMPGILEWLAKYAAVLGIIALGTAMIYDSAFWYVVDPSVLSLYTIADHIETAVQAVTVLVASLLATVAVTLGFVFLVGAIFDRKKETPPLQYGPPFFWIFLWVSLVVLSAVGLGHQVNRSGPLELKDIVYTGTDSQLQGRVLRFLDKGVVIKNQDDGRITFVPKDKITRVDRRVPRATNP